MNFNDANVKIIITFLPLANSYGISVLKIVFFFVYLRRIHRKCTFSFDRLRLFRHFDPFRVLVCSGDGSVGWVLSEIDRLNMQVMKHLVCKILLPSRYE